MSDQVLNFLIWYVCLLFALSVHEAAHAFAADRCGDPTGRFMGRMTLNPVSHIDPIGTVVMPALMFFTGIPFLIGWAKPVPFNPRNLHNLRTGRVYIALAGPASNLLLALLAAAALWVVATAAGMREPAQIMASVPAYLLLVMITLNLALMLFNLLPVPPLDGHHVLYAHLPPGMEERLERFGPMMFILIILFAGRLISGPLFFLQYHIVRFVLGG